MDQSSWACRSEPPARSAEKFHAPDTRLLSWHGTGDGTATTWGFLRGAKVHQISGDFSIIGNQWWYGGTPILGTAQCGKISASCWGTLHLLVEDLAPDFPKEQDMLTFIKLVGNIMWTKSKQLETLSKCHGGHQQTVFGQYCILWRNKKSIEIHIWSRPFPNILWSHIFSTAPNKPTAAAWQPITLKGVRPGSHGSPSRSSFTIGLRRNVHGMNALLPSLSSTPETKQDCYVNPLWNLDWWTLLTPMYVAIWGEMGWCWKEDQHGYPVAGKTVATFFGQVCTWGLFDLLTPQSTLIHFACSMFFPGNVGIDSILKNEPLDFQSPGSLEPNLWNSSSALQLPQGQIIPQPSSTSYTSWP